jgi:copper homeostasis protein
MTNIRDSVQVEICTAWLEHAIAAAHNGAHRLEFCYNLPVGGTTPEEASILALRRGVDIPIHVLVRPRAGGFVYSDEEFALLRSQIEIAKRLGMDGVVLGILDAHDRIDVVRTRILVDLARPLSVTFHRAFDACPDLDAALEAVIESGAARILTSGGKPSAQAGGENLARLVKKARGRIHILPGGGVRAENAASILHATGAQELHTSLGLSHLPDTELAGVPAEEFGAKVRAFLQQASSSPLRSSE